MLTAIIFICHSAAIIGICTAAVPQLYTYLLYCYSTAPYVRARAPVHFIYYIENHNAANFWNKIFAVNNI